MPTPSFILPTSVPVVDASVEALRVYDGSPAGFDVLPMSFTRASTATRTDSAGNVVSAVPYNLLQQSETFDNATWIASETTITANDFIAPNGTLTADRMNISGTNSRVIQSLSLGATTITFSVYLYSPVSFTLRLVATVDSLNSSRTITIPAGQWTRMSETFTSTSSITNVQIRGLAGGSTGDIYVWGAQVVLGTEPLPYQETVTRLALPRLDYRNADGTLSSTPRLLLEPQRTNLLTYSNTFTNLAWFKVNASITSDAIISPDGTQNASKLVESTANDSHHIYQNALSTGSNTFTFYAKAGERKFVYAYADNVGQGKCFDLENGTVGANIIASPTSSSITPAGNGWYRCSITITIVVGTALRIGTCSSNGTFSYLGNGTSGLFIYGAQVEAGAYATTYIPTTTAAVTRLADACSVTGVADLIGQTEGTLFAEFAVPLNESITRSLVLSSSTVANRAAISTFAGSVFARVDVGGVNQVNSNATMTVTNMNKVAFRYKENDFAVYVNGVKVITDTSGITFPAGTLDRFAFIQPDSTSAFNGTVSKIAFYNTGLIDSQLQSLTTL
jgi:hypothetical protein